MPWLHSDKPSPLAEQRGRRVHASPLCDPRRHRHLRRRNSYHAQRRHGTDVHCDGHTRVRPPVPQGPRPSDEGLPVTAGVKEIISVNIWAMRKVHAGAPLVHVRFCGRRVDVKHDKTTKKSRKTDNSMLQSLADSRSYVVSSSALVDFPLVSVRRRNTVRSTGLKCVAAMKCPPALVSSVSSHWRCPLRCCKGVRGRLAVSGHLIWSRSACYHSSDCGV